MAKLNKLLAARSNLNWLIEQLDTDQIDSKDLSNQLSTIEIEINNEIDRLNELEKENKSLKGQVEYYKQMLDSHERSMENSRVNPHGRWGY